MSRVLIRSPITSTRDLPNIRSAAGLNSMIAPALSMVTIASSAESSIARARASLRASAASFRLRSVMSSLVPIESCMSPLGSGSAKTVRCTQNGRGGDLHPHKCPVPPHVTLLRAVWPRCSVDDAAQHLVRLLHIVGMRDAADVELAELFDRIVQQRCGLRVRPADRTGRRD